MSKNKESYKTIKRETLGDIELYVNISRDGEVLKNDDGASDLSPYVLAFEIYESITSPGVEASIIFNDANGLIGALTGTEPVTIRVSGSVLKRTYTFRTYSIVDRTRVNDNTDVYKINCTTDEFIKNEVVNVFGNTEVLFEEDLETSKIVEELLSGDKYLGSEKKLFLEETSTLQRFIAPNWRPFDTIYWMAQRSVRGNSGGGTASQNGFIFYENALGYHFKSIDGMINEINQQTPDKTKVTNKGDTSVAKCKLYSYALSQKGVDDGSADVFKISKVTFPEERNYLEGLRQGAWAGYSIAIDPVTLPSSQYGESQDMPAAAHRNNLFDTWSKMAHLGYNKNDVNPLTLTDEFVQNSVQVPKRARLNVLPNQVFDQKGAGEKDQNYEKLAELAAYQWMRFQSLKQIQLVIQVPGNLDLYAGAGVDVMIPATAKSKTPKVDKKYSGRYMIVGVTHNGTTSKMETSLYLVKDAMRSGK